MLCKNIHNMQNMQDMHNMRKDIDTMPEAHNINIDFHNICLFK